MEKKFKRTTVTSALPYANGPVHIGHLAGVYVPADIYVRYLRLKKEDVVFIGGSDEHGVPITIRAKKEGITPQDVCDRYHKIIKDSFKEFGISFDIYSRTTSQTHCKYASDFFRKWFPRMCQYGFVEGRDYEFVPRVRPQDEGGRTVQRYVKDYRITQDMAKKLCKLHHTAVSAAYRPQPFDWDVLLGLLHKKPPRRSSYEVQLSDSDSLVTTTQIAKEYGCGAKVFNRLLHLHGIQYRANGQWVLYSEHHGKGYTSSLTFRLQRSDGSEVEKLHTAWTQKGRKFLYHTLKRRGVLPLAEQGG